MISLYHKISEGSAKLITKEYSTSFSIAVGLLDPDIRPAIYNIYGFVRVADEIVDTFDGYPQEELLDRFINDYRYALAVGISTNPVLNAFQSTIKKYDIDLALIDAFLKSMRADLTKENYEKESEIKEYIYGSADVVGLMCLKVFVNGDESEYQRLKVPAMKLGSAFQKVNFLRDMNHDYSTLNRSYFPGIHPERLNEQDKKRIVENVEEEFAEAYQGIKLLPMRARLGVYVAYRYYALLLKKIKKTPSSELLQKRISVPNRMKMLVLVKSYLKYLFNLI